MDCIACGCELIGYEIQPIAAICSENHFICIKCNKEYMRICPLCESEALYCDILPFDEKTFTLYVDMQRQNPETQQSAQADSDEEYEIIDAEEQVIEEQVEDEEAITEKCGGDEEKVSCTTSEDEETSKKAFQCVDSIIVGRKRIENAKQLADETANDVSSNTLSEPADEEQADSENDPSEIESDECSSLDSESNTKLSEMFKMITDNPVKPSKMQEKMSDRSFNSQLLVLCVDPPAGTPLNNTISQKGLEEQSELPSQASSTSKSSKKSKKLANISAVCLDSSGESQTISHTYECDLDQNLSQSADGLSSNLSGIEDGEKLFFWRSVKKGEYMYNSMFIKTAPKGDKRIQSVYEKLVLQEEYKNRNNATLYKLSGTDIDTSSEEQ